ncbi:MAG TPA: D-alanyl-D-alanine carboxypeptidase/D-alanyl-D-alanine-endopeptidase [Thermoanaerobaculia bacterium]|nr:D-alanyl-D-alanine carboxypeptidase/D-alanyl-D-alanine-endopeptidase [Thermoanaerobaculia bacterium]
MIPVATMARRGRAAAAVVVLALLAVAGGAAAAAPAAKASRATKKAAAPQTLEQRLTWLAKRRPVASPEYAVVVARVGETAPLVAVNADRPLILASTTKLFTSAAALDRLGEEYRFRTRLYRDAEIGPDGTLAGRLIVVGGGDPAISGRLYDDDPLAVFRPWAESLSRQGLRAVRDGLLLDTSFFDDVKLHPDWPEEQEGRWYQAPVSALSYNDNVVLVRASGGLRPGRPAVLGFHPAGPYLLSLIGRVSTTNSSTWMGIRRSAGSRTVVAAGSVGRNRTWLGDVTVPDPPLYFAAAFTRVLADAGIRVEGSPAELGPAGTGGTISASRTLLHTHETPILTVLSVANKRSQSFFSEQILKTLGAERRHLGSWENGLAEVADFLRSLGLDPGAYQLADGSGRSRSNRTSARAYVDFLQALATRWPHFAAFEKTMAVSGDPDGTLRNRLQGSATYGQVVAKTGNISGVVTLCGYVTAKSGQRYVFSILINGGIGEKRGHAWQDRFLNELATFG